MLFRRLGSHLKAHDWFAVSVDLAVLIIGLALAFQVDRWWEQRADRAKELAYVERLIVDVETDLPNIELAIGLQSLRRDFADLLMDTVVDPAAARAEPAVFLMAVDQAAFTFSPSLTRHTFEDLRSTGNMDLVRDIEVKRLLYDYHDYDQTQWQYRPLQFDTEFRHFTLAAGVVSDAQSRALQDAFLFAHPGNIEEVRAASIGAAGLEEAIERFRARPDLHAWLHQVREMQKEAILVHGRRLERAQALLAALTAYRAKLSP